MASAASVDHQVVVSASVLARPRQICTPAGSTGAGRRMTRAEPGWASSTLAGSAGWAIDRPLKRDPAPPDRRLSGIVAWSDPVPYTLSEPTRLLSISYAVVCLL